MTRVLDRGGEPFNHHEGELGTMTKRRLATLGTVCLWLIAGGLMVGDSFDSGPLADLGIFAAIAAATATICRVHIHNRRVVLDVLTYDRWLTETAGGDSMPSNVRRIR